MRGLGFRRTQPGRGWLQRCSALTARRRFSAFCRARQGATSSRCWRRCRAARCAHHAHRQRRAKTALPALASTFFPPATSLLSDEDMCMCIHNKRWDASRPAALTLRSTIMVADWCLRRLRLHLTLHQDDSQSLSGWTVNTWSRFARQRGERLRPLLAYPALATTPPPAATSTTAPAAAR